MRNQVDEERGLIVFLGAEFHPPRRRLLEPWNPPKTKRSTSRSRWSPASRLRLVRSASGAAAEGAAPSARAAQDSGGEGGQKKQFFFAPRKKS